MVDAVESAPSDLSTGQVAALIVYVFTLILWTYSKFLYFVRSPKECLVPSDSGEKVSLLPDGKSLGGKVDDDRAAVSPRAASRASSGLIGTGSGQSDDERASTPTRGTSAARAAHSRFGGLAGLWSNPVFRLVCFDQEAVLTHADTLACAAEFGTLMLWFFIADRTNLMPIGPKSYSRDVFMVVFLAITAAAFGGSLNKETRVMTLSRHQTEEWKGWMQVLFLLYHYFEAREAYNAIRVFIAGYVWMTGYGNFHYYYKTNDYCVGRFAQMMWRLNFLVCACCLVLRNSYMLYYICPMHTAFTILVYATLGIASHANASRLGMSLKFAAAFAVIFVFWDIKAVFYTVWWPFRWLVAYSDPRRPTGDDLYEWFFRSGLDRYVWIYGMFCAWIHPHVEALWKTMDAMRPAAKLGARSALLAAVALGTYQWYTRVYLLPKAEYNAVHPYTSWMPITLWVLARNFLPELRSYSLGLFGWLGCITLETYLSQFHTWLHSTIPDGQPKYLLNLVPGYPLINFAVVSAVYVYISWRFFNLTNTLKNAIVPHSDNAKLAHNALTCVVSGVCVYVLASLVHGSFAKVAFQG